MLLRTSQIKILSCQKILNHRYDGGDGGCDANHRSRRRLCDCVIIVIYCFVTVAIVASAAMSL